MLRFFRTIRRKLLEEDKMRKYIWYAVGEVLLVVIGILIALQINNWNEYKKERITELNYLVGIKNDLENDIPMVNNRINGTQRKISRLGKIDSTFKPYRRGVSLIDVSIDSVTMTQMFNRGPSTRLTSATYNTLTSNASAGLIKNVDLFDSLQDLYDNQDESIRSIYEDLKRREEYVGWKYAYGFKYSDFDSFFINNTDKEEVLADFDFYYRQHVLMNAYLINVRDLMLKIIEDIDTELNERNYTSN